MSDSQTNAEDLQAGRRAAEMHSGKLLPAASESEEEKARATGREAAARLSGQR